MGTVIKNRGTSCVGVRKTGTTLIHVSTVMGTLYCVLGRIQEEKWSKFWLNVCNNLAIKLEKRVHAK